MAGKTIKLYIMGSETKHLKSAELSNWTGKAFIGSRKHMGLIKEMEELKKPGIYFLVSQAENSVQKNIYIGEAEDVSHRINQHYQSKDKDWWESFIVFISKDHNLTKAHVKFLEKKCINIIKKNKTAFILKNSVEPKDTRLPQSDVDDLENYLDNMIFMLQHLGLMDFISTDDQTSSVTAQNAEIFYIELSSSKKKSQSPTLKAELLILDNGYRLLQGSYIEKTLRKSFEKHCYYNLWIKLEKDGLFDKTEYGDTLIIKEDIYFKSASAAASIVQGRSSNGLKEWKNNNGVTLDEYEGM